MIMLGPESAILLLCVAVPWVVIRVLRRIPFRRAVAEGLFAGYILAVLGVVFMPLRAVSPENAPYLWASVNVVPLHTVVEMFREFPGRVIQQLVGNVVLFVPLGFLLPVISVRCRRLPATASVALAFSAGIELVQLAMLLSLTGQRSVDIDDVILNVTGAIVGYSAWRVFRALASDQPAVRAVAADETT